MPNIARTMFGADTPSFLLALALLGALTLLVGGVKAFTAAAERVGLALGVAAACSPRGIQLGERYIGIDLNFMAGSAALLCLALADAHVGRLEGGVLLAAYAIYVAYQLIGGRTASATILALGASLLFYLLTQDRRVSRWEGLLFVAGYLLLVAELAGLA